MRIDQVHGWNFSPAEAIALQKDLAGRISLKNRCVSAGRIAGVDLSVKRTENSAAASVVLLDYPSLEIVEISTVKGTPDFPYVPGLLSFREMPLLLQAFEQLKQEPDLVIVDGQGIAHPRRIGLASHLGLFLDIPVIGCAKSRLCGSYEEPGPEPGDYSWLEDNGEKIGAVLRTKQRVKPVFISPGHRIDIENAVQWIINCCRGYRLPEPTRLAHLAAGGNLPESVVPR